jgi:hypothetical protein
MPAGFTLSPITEKGMPVCFNKSATLRTGFEPVAMITESKVNFVDLFFIPDFPVVDFQDPGIGNDFDSVPGNIIHYYPFSAFS